MSETSGRGRSSASGGRRAGSSPQRGGAKRRNAQGRERNRQSQGARNFSSSAPSQRRRVADPERLVAFEVLQAVETQDSYANLVLPSTIRRHGLDRRQAAFATELTYGTLRERGIYDAVLAECLDRKLSATDPKIVTALRLGAHQILGMRVPAHAALNQTVGLARGVIGAGPATMVNAVLRRVSEKSRDEWLAQLTEGVTDEVKRLSLETSHPAWIVRAFRQGLAAHGRTTSELRSLLDADNESPSVHLVALPGLGDLAEARENDARPGELTEDSAVYRHGDLSRLESVRSGTVRAQDAGSQLVARTLAATPIEGSDGAWLDLCAGPGGKAALLGALAVQRGAQLVANESAEHRADLVRKALAPLPRESYTVLTSDGRAIAETIHTADLPEEVSLAVEAFGETGEIFDRVMVDVPCSGLGALRRRPEARWRKTPGDIAELMSLQLDLARAAVAVTRPGGLIAYVTCSPHPAETQNVLLDLLNGDDVELLDTGAAMQAAALPGALEGDAAPGAPMAGAPVAEGQKEATTAQLWPHVHGTDAMFMALLRKK
ncbi:RsmB/NOP family class I SAM-dependent RNA methyltransferase [uncultured Kocuria sp.]|uniref:RsmB/NOP family class I SAM-dependent RNA methyltransferase n=1 Tax=uncultured Kocuria sp. TaxID=259305 RepID=UPI00259602BE|nr:transcription antitermination factor NusB [uncultured Kocuria sp.]